MRSAPAGGARQRRIAEDADAVANNVERAARSSDRPARSSLAIGPADGPQEKSTVTTGVVCREEFLIPGFECGDFGASGVKRLAGLVGGCGRSIVEI